MESTTDEETTMAQSNTGGVMSFVVALILFVWIFAGVAGMLYSVACVGQRGSFASKMGGLISSMLLGPLYWIYYFIAKSNFDYCL